MELPDESSSFQPEEYFLRTEQSSCQYQPDSQGGYFRDEEMSQRCLGPCALHKQPNTCPEQETNPPNEHLNKKDYATLQATAPSPRQLF